jgi:2-C-methyl-D-erythritol 4-phosphate cytidylyltransferase
MFMVEVGVVIPAAGEGKRMQAGINKQLLEIAGLPVLAHTLQIFQQSERVAEIVVVGAAGDLPALRRLIRDRQLTKVAAVVEGGAERQESVYAGIKALSGGIRRVVIHDGARPLLSLNAFERFLTAASGSEAAIMAIELKDTVKRIDATGWVVETPPRQYMRAVQTPQVFDRSLLEKAHSRAAAVGYKGTDDASLLEWLGVRVKVLAGETDNIKITTPEDLWLAEVILRKRKEGIYT